MEYLHYSASNEGSLPSILFEGTWEGSLQTNRRYLRNFETGEQKVVVLPQIIYSDLLETRLSSLRWRKFNVHNVSPVKALDRSLSSGIVSWPIRLRFLGSLSENNLALKRNSETPTHLDWKEKLKLWR